MHSAKAGKRHTVQAERSLPISCPSLVATLVLKAKLCIPQPPAGFVQAGMDKAITVG